jgi:hypothetical protein
VIWKKAIKLVILFRQKPWIPLRHHSTVKPNTSIHEFSLNYVDMRYISIYLPAKEVFQISILKGNQELPEVRMTTNSH